MATHEEENPDAVYMFAWALDGRRIGEGGTGATGRADSPNSITAPIVSYVCVFVLWENFLQCVGLCLLFLCVCYNAHSKLLGRRCY